MSATLSGRILYVVPKPAAQPSLFDAPAQVVEPKPARYEKKTTAEIKKALKEHFNYDFSVTKGRGTASHWVSVRWIDGPTNSDVHEFCLQFNDSSRDDTMTDLWCGCQYTNTHRDESYEAYMHAARIVCQKYGCKMPEVEKKLNYDGRYEYALLKDHNYRVEGEYFSQLVYREFAKIDYRNISQEAEAAAAVEEIHEEPAAPAIETAQEEPAAVAVLDLDYLLEEQHNLLACFA